MRPSTIERTAVRKTQAGRALLPPVRCRLAPIAVGLDVAKLIDDMESDAVNSHLAVSQGLARDLGFTGTPAFVIGDALVPGAVPLDELQELVAQARTDG